MSDVAVTRVERRAMRGGLVGPVALIAAGVVLLLNNLGLIGWEIWSTLLQLWPVLLIAIGLDLIVGRRSTLVSLLIGVLTIAALAAGAWYLGVRPGAAAHSEAVSYELQGAQRANVAISVSAGELRLRAQAEPSGLIAGTVPLASGERLEREFAVRGGEAHLKLQTAGRTPLTFGGSQFRQPWDLRLTRDVPLQLNVNAGAGRTEIDLTHLQVTDVDLDAGVGETVMTLPGSGRLSVSISAGVGETTVRIPANMAARIHVSGGIGDKNVDRRFVRDGEYYTSADYATAQNRVELQISSGVGEISIESVPAE